jgi:fibronectin-binding autotransporter adhesin
LTRREAGNTLGGMIHNSRLAVLALLALAPAAPAQTYIWDGGLSHGNFTVNNLWSTANNWVGGVPTSGQNVDVAFNLSGLWTSSDQDIADPFVLHSLTFSANSNVIALGALGLNFQSNTTGVAPLLNQNSGIGVVVSNPIGLTNSLTVQGGGTGNLILSGPLSGTGSLTKSGNFGLILGADNSGYGGGVTVSGGSIVLGDANALAGSTVTVNVDGGLILKQASPTLGGLAGTGSVTAGPLTTALTVGGNNASTTYSGALTGSAMDVMKTGAGGWALSGTGSSYHSLAVTNGTITLNGGTLATNSTSAAGSPHRAVEVGTGSAAAALVIQGGAVLDTSTGSEAVAGFSSAAQSITVQGSGTLWKLPSQTDIGGGGTATLTVQNGARLTGGNFLDLGNSGTGTIQVLSGGQINVGSVFLAFNGAGTVAVGGAGSSVTAGAIVLANNGGADTGTLTVTNGGSVSTGGLQISSLTSSIAVNGGTLSTGTVTQLAGATIPIAITDPAGGTAFTVGTNNASSTIAGPISDEAGGPGTVNKVGTGTLTLTGHLTNTGGYVAGGGTIDFGGAVVQPGSGSLTAAAGATIRYDGGARVFGGFLRGPGTHAVNGAAFTGTTAIADAVINQTGPATYANFTNGGSLSVVGGLIAGTTFNGFSNEGSGSITVGAGSKVNAAAFQSYGVLTLSPGSPGAATQLTNTGTTPLYFNGGSRTFIGTPPTAGQNLALVDLHGQNAVVAGGLFVNNGFVGDSTGSGATIVADYGALVKGGGTFQSGVITQNGGKFQAGNSPGISHLESLVLGPGGTQSFNWQINNATGRAGAPPPDQNNLASGWSLLSVEKLVDPFTGQLSRGDLDWTGSNAAAQQFNMSLQTLLNPTPIGTDNPGPMANFDPAARYSWEVVAWQGTYVGPTDDATLTADTNFDFSNFVNPLAGTFGLHFNTAFKEIDLVYTPVPEPGTLVLTGLAGLLWAVRRRKPFPLVPTPGGRG